MNAPHHSFNAKAGGMPHGLELLPCLIIAHPNWIGSFRASYRNLIWPVHFVTSIRNVGIVQRLNLEHAQTTFYRPASLVARHGDARAIHTRQKSLGRTNP